MHKPCLTCSTTDAAEFWKGQKTCKRCQTAYRQQNRQHYLDMWKAHAAQWAKENPDKARQKYNDYKARLKAAPGQLSPRLVSMVYEIYGRKCLKCGSTKNLTIDHVLPLTLGGSNCLDNLQPLCLSCNSGKGGRYADYRPYMLPGEYRVREAEMMIAS